MGTCSWSKVMTSHPAANARSVARSSTSPTVTSETTWAAEESAVSESSRNRTPRAIPAWCVMRASWPPPTIPTTGDPRRLTTGERSHSNAFRDDRYPTVTASRRSARARRKSSTGCRAGGWTAGFGAERLPAVLGGRRTVRGQFLALVGPSCCSSGKDGAAASSWGVVPGGLSQWARMRRPNRSSRGRLSVGLTVAALGGVGPRGSGHRSERQREGVRPLRPAGHRQCLRHRRAGRQRPGDLPARVALARRRRPLRDLAAGQRTGQQRLPDGLRGRRR